MIEGCADYIRENHETIIDEHPGIEVDLRHEDSSRASGDVGWANLVVTSPPYPMVEMWDDLGGYEDQHQMIKDVLHRCFVFLDDGGIACINIGDATRSVDGEFQCYPNHAEILVNAREMGFTPLVSVQWFKPTNRPNSFLGSGFMPPNCYVTQDTEYILILRKGEKRETSDSDPLRRASAFTKEERDTWFSQQWKVKGRSQEGYAAYPKTIPYRLIRMFSVMGDTVLDPFMGTGTTGQMAVSLGRSFVGYEIEEEPYEMAVDKVPDPDELSVRDVLCNLVNHEQLEGIEEPELFVRNPNQLVDPLK